MDHSKISIVLPALNEAAGLSRILPDLTRLYTGAEIIVVDSGSSDDTASIARQHGVKVVTQPYAYGNGAAVKAGLRAATRDYVVFMDADGQHFPDQIAPLLNKLEEGYDMAVGARAAQAQAGLARGLANRFYNLFASWMTNRTIADLTSGMRAINRLKAREFLHLLPNGFSYPTTITMAFFRNGYSVAYVPVEVGERLGTSHINPIKDGIRFLLIIFKIGTLYSPMRVFIPVSLVHLLAGVGYYLYTYSTMHRLTNMSVILFSIASIIFMMGLLSEQITNLYYSLHDERKNNQQ